MKWRRRFEVVALGTSGSAISQRSVISEHRTERDAREAAGLERRRLEVIRAEEAASWSIQVVRGDEILHEERPFDGHREDVPVPPLTALHIRQSDESPAGPTPADVDDVGDPTPTGSFPAVPGDAGSGAEPEADAPPAAPAAADAVDAPVAERADVSPQPPEDGPRSGDPDSAAPTGGVAPAEVPEFDGAPEFAADAPDDTGATGRVARPQASPERESGSRPDADPPPSGPVPDDIIRRFEESIARERARNARR